MKIIRGRTIKFIHRELDVSPSVIKHTLKLWRETGEVVPHKKTDKERRLRIMTDSEIQVSSASYLPLHLIDFINFVSLVPFYPSGAKTRHIFG
jgi:hypothetical protein